MKVCARRASRTTRKKLLLFRRHLSSSKKKARSSSCKKTPTNGMKKEEKKDENLYNVYIPLVMFLRIFIFVLFTFVRYSSPKMYRTSEQPSRHPSWSYLILLYPRNVILFWTNDLYELLFGSVIRTRFIIFLSFFLRAFIFALGNETLGCELKNVSITEFSEDLVFYTWRGRKK